MAAASHLLRPEIPSMNMDPSLPLSPTASSNDGPLPSGFDELVHHNNTGATSFPRDHAVMEDASVHTPSQPASRMSTPAPHHAMTPQSQYSQYGLPPQQRQSMYANDYTYQTQQMYESPDGAYPSLPDDPPYSTPASSPSQRSDMLNLRNGAVPHAADAVPRPLASKARVQKPKKKKGREKADKDKVHLEKPLSEMGEEWKVSMSEIEVYINRSAEARHDEIANDRKQPGKIKRPMNSFMLYRKAFQNHTKAYCEHNNHQVVSKVCGASWDQEPETIRKQFGEWAKMERANHQKAHPGYKFTPAKPKNAKRKHNSDDESELETYDWDSGQKIKRNRSHTGTPAPDELFNLHHGYYQPPQHHPQQYAHHPNQMTSRAMQSSYGYLNPNKQMPAPYGSMVMGQSGQYLSSNTMTNMNYQQRGYPVEDVAYHKTPSPSNHYQQGGMSRSVMDQYGPPQQSHGMEHTPPPTGYMHSNSHLDNSHLNSSLYPISDNSFSPRDPLNLSNHAIDSGGLDFNFNGMGGHQPLGGEGPHEFGADGFAHDQHAQQLLRGNDQSWDIQPLDEGQADEQYDEYGMDPSLSEPYAMNDPSLSEAYIAQD